MATKDIGKKTKLGVVYNTLAKLISTFGQIISTIVLARLLVPEEVGIVTAGMIVIGGVTKFGEFGFHNGLVQRKDEVEDIHIHSLFWMDFAFKAAIWLGVFLTSPWLATFFEIPELEIALPVLAIFMLLECFSTTPKAVMRRNMDFKSTSIINTVDKYVSIVTSISLAALGFSFWSLIYCKLLSSLIAGIISMTKARWIPRFQFSFQASKELFHFGVMVAVRNLFKYGSDRIDRLLITKFIGAGAVAIYEKAFELMRMPQKQITRSVNRVVFSAFSRIQDEPERIRRAFRKLILAVSLLSFPMLFGMAYVAPTFIPIALGENWLLTIVPVQIMCVAGIIRSTDPFLNSLLTATGYVRSTVTRRAIEFVIIAVATSIGVQYGVPGVAFAITGASIIVTIMMLSIITKVTNVSWGDYFMPQMPALVASTGMLAAIHLATMGLQTFASPGNVVLLLVQTTVGLLVYPVLHLLFGFKEVKKLWRELAGDSKQVVSKISKKLGLKKRHPGVV